MTTAFQCEQCICIEEQCTHEAITIQPDLQVGHYILHIKEIQLTVECNM